MTTLTPLVGNEGEGTIVCEALKAEALVVPSYMISQLHENQVILNLQQAADLEMKTRTQSLSELWHSEKTSHKNFNNERNVTGKQIQAVKHLCERR